ncbi:MAG: SGNH/GDSL hydrolase family protein [Alphaproteobacteria bacterium]|nr:SGNH/GDSL hydrolase family protein [Alphaproteobacteria bacterium]
MKASPLTPLVILAVLSLLLAVVVTETVLYSRATPANHPEWILSKRLVPSGVMGGAEAFETRNLLRNNRLNLHEWHGYHEVLLDRIFALGELRARFKLGPDGYLIAIFNKNAAGYSGVRVSRNPLFPNLFFRATDTGEFLVSEALEDVAVDNGWHELHLRFEGGMLEVSVDDLRIGRIEEPSQDEQVIGLRSGRRKAVIDDIEVAAADGSQIIADDFRNRRGFWTTLVSLFAFLFLVAAAIYLASRRRGGDGKPALFSLIMVEAVLAISFLLYFLFDYYAYSKKYHFKTMAEWVATTNEALTVEAMRRYVFTEFPFADFEGDGLRSYWPERVIEFLGIDLSDVGKKSWLTVFRGPPDRQEVDFIEDSREGVDSYLGRNPLGASLRILLLGTSQTWGVGANAADERMAPTLQRFLSQQLGPEHGVSVINASKWGSRSGPLLDRYKSHARLFQPDVVVVNLSNNGSADGFAEDLTEMAQVGRDISTETVFVLEANTTEVGNFLGTKHGMMRAVAAANDIPVIDLHGYMSQPSIYDSGVIWWDRVHMTSYGQRLAAEFIGRAIVENFDLRETSASAPAPPDAGN